ncbi:MAG TPA: VOC family protein [Vicinamibacterales bacterium]|jgi:predicted enzyme related to lactoylglutathione lyase
MTTRMACVAAIGSLVIGAAIGRATAQTTSADVAPLPVERVTGIGGVFFKAKDPKALTQWYREHLGVNVGVSVRSTTPAFEWRERDNPSELGSTTWAIFPDTTKYFLPSTAPFMLNYRVRSLDRMIAQLRAHGVQVEPRITEEAAGRFAWIMDPEGNRIELWEPGPNR